MIRFRPQSHRKLRFQESLNIKKTEAKQVTATFEGRAFVRNHLEMACYELPLAEADDEPTTVAEGPAEPAVDEALEDNQ